MPAVNRAMFDAVPQLNVLSLAIFFPSRIFELLFFFIFVFFFPAAWVREAFLSYIVSHYKLH